MDYPDRFIRRVVITVAITGAAYIAWQVKAVLMIIFGGMIVATLLSALADKIGHVLPFNRKVTVTMAILVILIILGVTGWWVGGNIASQLEELRQKLPQAFSASVSWLQQFPLAKDVLEKSKDLEDMSVPLTRVAGFTGTALGALANTVLIFAIGIYVAATPELYRRGLVQLIPPVYRERSDYAFLAAANGLRQWLIGQMLTMVIVGTLSAVGLKLLGIPLALSLGLIAGLLEFVPFVGPLAFGLLAVVMAFMQGPTSALHVALLILAIQQLEGNVITPLVQRHTVKLAPALALVSVVIFAALFGVLGVLFATPLMVMTMILIQKLYIECALEAEQASPDRPSMPAPG